MRRLVARECDPGSGGNRKGCDRREDRRCILNRRMSRQVSVGGVLLGGGSPVVVQSMTNTPTSDVDATLAQIGLLAENGSEIVRIAVPDQASAEALAGLVAGSPVPLVADIHFDADLALAALRGGIHKLRLNPGNIRRPEDVRTIAGEAGERGVPIRIGVNIINTIAAQVMQRRRNSVYTFVDRRPLRFRMPITTGAIKSNARTPVVMTIVMG